jgi:hypothetical protein
VHGDPLKVAAVGQNDIGMKLEASFTKATEDADDIVSAEQLSDRHC